MITDAFAVNTNGTDEKYINVGKVMFYRRYK